MLNDELLSAYLDGELDQTKRALVESWLASDTGAATRLDRMSNADAALRRAIPRVAPDAADPVAALIMGRTSATVIPLRRTWARQAAAIAAACVLGVLVGRLDAGDSVNGVVAPGMELSAAIENILDTASSGGSAPIMGGEVQMALTFQTESGGVCRQFRTTSGARAADALACRDGGEWRLVVQAEAPSSSEEVYRTAGAEPSPIEAAVNAMGGAIVLNESEERALMSANWRARP